ncbi:MAG TPA: polysaccharide deacetylase family protein [Terriglobales bacterium]|nr:polysaccharide deacetylase family protein [Terriglobales bacterium]
MRFISPLLKHVVFPGLARAGYLNRRAGSGPAILTYHGVWPREYGGVDPNLDGSLVSADSFRRQLALLRDRYRVISPEQFLLWQKQEMELPPRSVLLTCDDGLVNTLGEMLPVLHEFQIECLFFVTGASISGLPAMLWHEELHLMLLSVAGHFKLELDQIGLRCAVASSQEKSDLCWRLVTVLSGLDGEARRRLLNAIRVQLGLPEDWASKYLHDPSYSCRFRLLDQPGLRELQAAGMAIGAHTLSHSMLSQLPTQSAWREISESRCRLERALGEPVWALAYPFGYPRAVTRRDQMLAQRAGFTCAFLNAGGGFGAPVPPFALPRVHVSGEMNLAEFEAHLSGFYSVLRRRFLGEVAEEIVEVGA